MLAGAGLSTGANIYSSRKQDKYAQEMEEEEKRRAREEEKNQRRAALARAIGGEGIYGLMQRPAKRNVIEPPNLTTPSIIGGVGNLMSAFTPNYLQYKNRNR